MQYEPIIGLEIHVELKTKSKMFCGCPADHFGKTPNTQTCPVCLGLPGALPVPNRKAVEWVMRMGMALGSDIAQFSKFDRKNYFYPDLPKGYQLSQYDEPLCVGGVVKTSFGDVRIRRVHLEEDTGKLVHTSVKGFKVTLVDFNRSGVPLAEIVTEPDVKNAEQAKEFLKKLHQIVRYLGISDADMEKGSMRLEPNISLRKAGETGLPPYKVEVKNINSFRFAERAIEYEIERHARILDAGKLPVQETRGWDEAKNATVSQRTKEEAADYRYFPEPDIPPMRFTEAYVANIRSAIGELPDAKANRFMQAYGLSQKDVDVLTESLELATYYEEAVRVSKQTDEPFGPKDIANWMINKKPDINSVLPAALIAEIKEAKAVVAMSGDAMNTLIQQILESNAKAVTDYKLGKEAALMFLMGQVKRQLPKGDTKQIIEALRKALT